MGPYSRIDVSIRPVSHSTNRMKEPSTTIPGSSSRCEIRPIIVNRNTSASADVVISYGNILDANWFLVLVSTQRPRGRGREDEPGDADSEGFLHGDEVGEDTQRRCGRGNHDQQPEVELCFGPVISPPSFPDTDLGRHCEMWSGVGGWRQKCGLRGN